MNDKDKILILELSVENAHYFSLIAKLQDENAKLRECLKACPILGEIHRDSNDRFKEWNLEFNYVLKELEDK